MSNIKERISRKLLREDEEDYNDTSIRDLKERQEEDEPIDYSKEDESKSLGFTTINISLRIRNNKLLNSDFAEDNEINENDLDNVNDLKILIEDHIDVLFDNDEYTNNSISIAR